MPRIWAARNRYDIEALLLDKDGTLLDFMYTWGRWSERLFAAFSSYLPPGGLGQPAEAMQRLLGIRPADDGAMVCDYDRNGPLAMGTVENLIAILAWQGYRSGLSFAEAKEAAYKSKRDADWSIEAERAAKLLPDVRPFLERCRDNGIRLAVVTADETEAAEKHLEWLGIRHYFAACVGTDQVERGKPCPDMAELACRLLGVEPGKAAVIGDTNGDMLMAKAAGAAAAIGINYAGEQGMGELSQADVCIASFKEIAIEEGQ